MKKVKVKIALDQFKHQKLSKEESKEVKGGVIVEDIVGF